MSQSRYRQTTNQGSRINASSNSAGQSNAIDSEVNLQAVEEQSDIILSILWKHGKLVASYYSMSQKLIYVISETVDLHPKFPATQSLIRQLQPHHLITSGRITDAFIEILIDTLTRQECIRTENNATVRKVPANMTLLDEKEFSYNTCLHRVKNLRIVSEPEELPGTDRFLYIQSLVNLSSNSTLHMLGALIKFLDQTWRTIRPSDDDELIFMHIQQVTLADHVYIDNTTFKTLNVFNQLQHDSSFKYGGQTSTREGRSLFKLLSEHCTSKLGFLKLRDILVTPIKNVNELRKRYDFMDLIVNPRNAELVSAINESKRKISNVMKILNKLQHSQGNTGQWKTLYQTILAILQINEVIKPYLKDSEILQNFSSTITDHLYHLESCIQTSLDFEGAVWGDRPLIREGIDKALDEAKAKYLGIKSRLTAAARTVIKYLPSYLEDCSVFYVPDMGHVIGVHKWAPNCKADELLQYGCYYLFELNNDYHYKNALCQELDNQLGDLPSEIHYHENRIIQRIAKYIIKESIHILNPLQEIALIDALSSMAKVGAERQFVRPKFNADNIIDIQNGYHPLIDLENYVTNDFKSGGPNSYVKIITGPNASGKSVYLKQVCLITYMAHIGSYLPATKVNISPVHSIHTRMHATESAALNMSAFYIDLTQMCNALYNAKRSSLVIMDEFGRGTAGPSSNAILLGALRKFTISKDNCPHTVVSTHMPVDKECLPSSLIQYQKMDYMRHPETRAITFLYKVINGESTSFTFEMAADFLDASTLERAMQINQSIDMAQVYDNNYLQDIAIPPFDD